MYGNISVQGHHLLLKNMNEQGTAWFFYLHTVEGNFKPDPMTFDAAPSDYLLALSSFSGYGSPTASNVVLLWASQSYSYSYESDHCSSSSCDDYKQVNRVFGYGVVDRQYLTYTFFDIFKKKKNIVFVAFFWNNSREIFSLGMTVKHVLNCA